MKKHYICTSTNDLELYYSFLPSVYKMWKTYIPDCIFVLGYIGKKEKNSDFVKWLESNSDIIYIFKQEIDIDSGIQSKITRMWLASLFDNNITTIVDIDQYLLDFNWFKNMIKPVYDYKFVTIGHNIYDKTSCEGKFPMSFTTTISNILKNVINKYNLNYNDWLKSLKNLDNIIDGGENIYGSFKNFSDESLLRYLLNKEKDYINSKLIKQIRDDCAFMLASKRIDRTAPIGGEWKDNNYLIKLNNGYYRDCQPIRPYNEEKLKNILDYIFCKKYKL